MVRDTVTEYTSTVSPSMRAAGTKINVKVMEYRSTLTGPQLKANGNETESMVRPKSCTTMETKATTVASSKTDENMAWALSCQETSECIGFMKESSSKMRDMAMES